MDWIANIIAPIIVALIVGLVGWFLRQYIDSVRRERERLQDERRKIYMHILEPYIRLFASTNDPKESEIALEQIQSFKYRKATFEVKLMGSDEVILATNKLMKHFYAREASVDSKGSPDHKAVFLMGELFISVRKDLIKKTKLNEVDMLRDFIKDIDQYLDSNKRSSR